MAKRLVAPMAFGYTRPKICWGSKFLSIIAIPLEIDPDRIDHNSRVKVPCPMDFPKTSASVLLAMILLGGCAFTDEALFPKLAPGNSSGGAGAATVAEPPTTYSAPSVSSGSSTGTYVGQKVASLRGDLQQLQSSLSGQNDQLQQIRNDTVRDSQAYHGTVAAIESRLQVGTTPGNPILVQHWNDAQGQLDHIHEDVLKMTRLSTKVASTSGTAAYLLDSIRAARSLSGAVDEDHRQLRGLEDETNSTTVVIERLLTELSTDVQRQQQYVGTERNNLNTLALAIKNGQLYGSSLANARSSSLPLGPVAATSASIAALAADRPRVVIRFDRPNGSYEYALYTAVKSALDRRPEAMFDVVAVAARAASPGTAALNETTARRNAEAVVRSLSQMGLPSDRIRISSAGNADAATGEVKIFVH